MKLYEDERLLEDLVYDAGQGAYVLNYNPKANHAYQLVVHVNGRNSLTASTRVPENSTVQACISPFPESGMGLLSGRVIIDLHIPRAGPADVVWIGLSSKSYRAYRVEGPPYRRIDSSKVVTNLIWSVYSASSVADPFNGGKDEGLNEYYLYLRLNPAGHLSGYEVDVATVEGGSYETHQRLPNGLGQYVHVYVASEEYDRFLKNAVLDYLNNNLGSDIPNPFAEQVVNYSNVKGGTGVFAGYNSTTLYVRNLNQCP